MLPDKLGECVAGLMRLVCLLFSCVSVRNNKVEPLRSVLTFGAKHGFHGHSRMCIA